MIIIMLRHKIALTFCVWRWNLWVCDHLDKSLWAALSRYGTVCLFCCIHTRSMVEDLVRDYNLHGRVSLLWEYTECLPVSWKILHGCASSRPQYSLNSTIIKHVPGGGVVGISNVFADVSSAGVSLAAGASGGAGVLAAGASFGGGASPENNVEIYKPKDGKLLLTIISPF